MLNSKDYCDYDTCVALKELGLNNVTEARLSISAKVFDLKPEPYIELSPKILLYDAQKWLREEKGIGITIFHNYYHDTREMYYQVELYNTEHYLKTFGEFSDWTQALSEGVKEAVKILKNGIPSKR